MEGYYERNIAGDEKPKGTLNISVKNIDEFNKLLEQAKNEADQLQRTIDRLRWFELKIEFSILE